MLEYIGPNLVAEFDPSDSTWSLRRPNSTVFLGQVRLSGSAWCYVVETAQGTCFDATCLRALADFCEAKTVEHARGGGEA